MPTEDSWGNPAVIWKKPPWWLSPPQVRSQPSIGQVLQKISENNSWHKKMRAGLAGLIENLASFDHESEWDSGNYVEKTIPGQIIAILNFQGSRDMRIQYSNKEYAFPGDIAGLITELYHNLFHLEFSRLFRRSKGIFNVVSMYEKEYEKALLQTGNLTFNDAQLLLSPSNSAPGGTMMSRCPDPKADRIFIDYRLDAKIDHWLLDEFQDTSNLQWQAMENLVDEILQDDSNQRSFFYVGDIKQTIYRWRGGNPDLFNNVLNHYGKKITVEPLDKTQRSAQPVIDTVNKVFSSLPETRENDAEETCPAIPAPVLAKWNAAWRKHECGIQAPPDGYAALLRPALPEGVKYHENDEHLALLAQLLNQLRPTEKGLSAAILARKNRAGKEITDYLRQYCPEMNISYEGETVLLDSPVVKLLLDLLRYAEHPADNFAKQHLRMSPLGKWLDKNNVPVASLPFLILREIQSAGFKAALRIWASRLGTLDAFGRLRLDQMLEIAGQFDGRYDRNIRLFINTVETFKMREASEAKGCVHVMTIHQAKGLGFDLVILPDFNAGERLNSAGALDYLTGHAYGAPRPEWLLAVPDRKIAECDPELMKSLEERDNLETLDNLCLLYVAMTRAKKALYMITRVRQKKYYNLATLLEQQLAGDENHSSNIQINGFSADVLYETGNRAWHEKEKTTGTSKTPEKDRPAIPKKACRAILEKIEPSLEEDVALKASWLFKAESPEVLYFGSAIHELFRQVEWSGNCRPDEIIRNWKPEYPYPDIVLRDVKTQFMRTMTESKIKAALSKPAGLPELWREKSFDVILDNKWVSGIFDRVVILRDNDGTPISAKIMDYKSNRTSDPQKINVLVATYRPQMTFYRQALANLLNLPGEKIETHLLFTVPRLVVSI